MCMLGGLAIGGVSERELGPSGPELSRVGRERGETSQG